MTDGQQAQSRGDGAGPGGDECRADAGGHQGQHGLLHPGAAARELRDGVRCDLNRRQAEADVEPGRAGRGQAAGPQGEGVQVLDGIAGVGKQGPA